MPLSRRGSEPVTAKSPYGLRRVLAWIALTAGTVGGAAFGLTAYRTGGKAAGFWAATAVCALVVLTAIVDLAVLRRRR